MSALHGADSNHLRTGECAIIREGRDGSQYLSVYGEIDLSNGNELSEAIEAAEGFGEPIVVDLSPCKYVDSTGLTILVRAIQRRPEQMRILAPKGSFAHRLLTVTSLLHELPVHGE